MCCAAYVSHDMSQKCLRAASRKNEVRCQRTKHCVVRQVLCATANQKRPISATYHTEAMSATAQRSREHAPPIPTTFCDDYKRQMAQNALGVAEKYNCGYCGRLKISASRCTDGQVRIRCQCGGVKRDGILRVHANWRVAPHTDVKFVRTDVCDTPPTSGTKRKIEQCTEITLHKQVHRRRQVRGTPRPQNETAAAPDLEAARPLKKSRKEVCAAVRAARRTKSTTTAAAKKLLVKPEIEEKEPTKTVAACPVSENELGQVEAVYFDPLVMPKDINSLLIAELPAFKALLEAKRNRAETEAQKELAYLPTWSLCEIVRRLPTTTEELTCVRGFGWSRASQYGEMFLTVLEPFRTELALLHQKAAISPASYPLNKFPWYLTEEQRTAPYYPPPYANDPGRSYHPAGLIVNGGTVSRGWRVEYARGTAQCKSCAEPIRKGKLRICCLETCDHWRWDSDRKFHPTCAIYRQYWNKEPMVTVGVLAGIGATFEGNAEGLCRLQALFETKPTDELVAKEKEYADAEEHSRLDAQELGGGTTGSQATPKKLFYEVNPANIMPDEGRRQSWSSRILVKKEAAKKQIKDQTHRVIKKEAVKMRIKTESHTLVKKEAVKMQIKEHTHRTVKQVAMEKNITSSFVYITSIRWPIDCP